MSVGAMHDPSSSSRPGGSRPSGSERPFDRPSGDRGGYDRPSGDRGGYDRPSGGYDRPSGDRGYGRGYGSDRGYGNNDRGYGGSDRGYGGSDRRGFDEGDPKLMGADITTLGLDPSGMAPIVKDFYREHPDVAAMTEDEIRAFREAAQMTITGSDVPKPVKTVAQAGFAPELVRRFEASGHTAPTAIQAQGWTMALSGRNMVGIAQTGSGKTLSFVLPALVHIAGQAPLRRGDGPIVLVLAPTRELAVQIQEVARTYGGAARVRSTCLYGGASKGPQIRAMQAGCEIVVATPGRLLDLLDEHHFTLERVSYLVLDEADRMLDMGFEPQIRRILAGIRRDRQVLFWSATWPKSVMRLATDLLGREYIQVKIGSSELVANRKISQRAVVCAEHEKVGHLTKVLEDLWNAAPAGTDGRPKQMPRTIVFCNKKRVVDNVTRALVADRWPALAIHGDKSQGERDHALRMLRSGQAAILVATDVAARGLDVKDVAAVVNFDMPDDIENYIHRIGRTARGDAASGTSHAFVTQADGPVLGDLVKIMEEAGQEVPSEVRMLVPARRTGGGGGGYGRRGGYGGGRSGFRGGNRYRPY